MAGNSVVGALRVVLGLDSAQFTGGLTAAQRELKRAGKQFERIGGQMSKVGATLSIGVTAPIVALGYSSLQAAKQSQQAFGQVEAALKSMGAASGKTAGELQKSAAKLQAMSTFDDDDILQKVTANLLTFGNVSGQAFDRAQQAAVDLSARLGQDLQSSAIQLGKALNDPVKGITALSRVGVSFTAQQQEQIKAMTAAGDVAGAQNLILTELEKQYGGAAKALRDATPEAALTDSWREFQETIGAIAIEVLPPLTSALTGALDAFNKLSPGMQTFIVGGAALAATVGPIIAGVGGVVSGVGALLPVFGAVAAFTTATLIPALGGVATFLTATLIPAAIATAPVWGPIALAVGAVGAAIFALIKWWPQIKEFAINVGQAMASAAKVTVQAAKDLFAGVKTWIQDKLAAVFKWVIDKAKAVGDAFFELYDRVVGHSYVPDMIDGIETEFGRLDGVMVNPALAANENVAQSFANTADSVLADVGRIFAALKQGDWTSALGGLSGALNGLGSIGNMLGASAGSGLQRAAGSVASITQTVGALTSAGGLLAGAGSLFGAGSAGLFGGTTISPMILQSALGSTIAGTVGTAGGLGGFIGGIGGALASNPIGWALMAAALASSFLGPKPTNAGAGYDLTTGQLSGNKRTSETERAVTTAGDAILAGEQLLKDAGITLGATVRGLVIGTRDLSQIYLTNGRTLTSAVGDASAAVDTAMRALLDGATYANEAQEKLVDSMVAAGKSFNDIAQALSASASAQGLGSQFADAILQMTDPAAYAKAQLQAQQGARRSQVQAAADAGYLTADQLATLNEQLTRLEGLELDKLLKDSGQDLASAIDTATSDLRSAYDAQVQAIQANLDEWKSIGSDLASFRRGLDKGSLSGLSVTQQAAAAKALYDKTLAGVNARDKDALKAFPSVAQDYLEAARAAAVDSAQYQQILAGVKGDTAAAAAYAASQVDAAEAQLAALQTMVSKLIDIDASIQAGTSDVVSAISALGTALTKQAASNDNGAVGYTSAPAWFDPAQYWADNPDLARDRAKANGFLTKYASDMEAALAHFLGQGQFEIAAGTRKYANGGGFKVGGFGSTDSQLVAFRASPQEHVDIFNGSQIARIDARLNQLGAMSASAAIERRLSAIEAAVRATAQVQRRWDGDGLPNVRAV